MKILVVGSDSIHLSSFLKAGTEAGLVFDFLAEEPCDFEGVQQEFTISFRNLNPIAIRKSNREVRSLLNYLQPEVVHIHQVNRLAYFVSRQCTRLKIPVLTTAWGSDVLVIPEQSRFFRFLVRKTLKRSSLVTADSLEMIEAMQRLVPSASKYVHLQYGIDPVKALPKEKIVYSNRLHKPLYRIDQVIKYMDYFRSQHPDWKLVIAGTGTETEALQQMVRDRGMEECVEFVGWLEKEENHQWYGKSAIYISIPKHDGTAVSLLEAMSAGCIPIVPNLAVSREWIEDGVNGIIEQEGRNPLDDALLLNQQECAEMNQLSVASSASRKVCTQRFIELYTEIKDV